MRDELPVSSKHQSEESEAERAVAQQSCLPAIGSGDPGQQPDHGEMSGDGSLRSGTSGEHHLPDISYLPRMSDDHAVSVTSSERNKDHGGERVSSDNQVNLKGGVTTDRSTACTAPSDDISDTARTFHDLVISPVPAPVIAQPIPPDELRLNMQEKAELILKGDVNIGVRPDLRTVHIFINSAFRGKSY